MKLATTIVAIIVIGALAGYALHKGQDGVLLAAVFAIIAGLGGYIAPHKPPK